MDTLENYRKTIKSVLEPTLKFHTLMENLLVRQFLMK
jgi:hypothetical protein